MSPIQPGPGSDPRSRDFIPGPFNLPRLKQTWESTIASDLLTLTYNHKPPGTPKEIIGERLRSWDGSSPYHAGRPLRGPRGSANLWPVERDITFNNVPTIRSISISAYLGSSAVFDPRMNIAAQLMVQSLTGKRPRMIRAQESVSAFKIKKRRPMGAVATMYGNEAWEFLDKCITLVFPRIKDWPGVKGSSGTAGTIAFGLTGEQMQLFPDLALNWSVSYFGHLAYIY
jgi:large subunit ribosomal protein L5